MPLNARTARPAIAGAVALAVITTGAVAVSAAVGAGAELPAAAYQAWCQASGKCTYVVDDSSGGLSELRTGKAAWAGEDEELAPHEVAKAGGPVAYYPTLVAGIAVAANVPGIDGGDLQLTDTALGHIFSGSVTNWNAPEIRVANRHKSLPRNLKITLCVPGTPSGESYDMSEWLAEVSPTFRRRVGGASLLPPWKAATIDRTAHVTETGECMAAHEGAITFLPVGDAMREGLVHDIVAVGKKEKVVYEGTKKGAKVVRTEWVFTHPTEEAIQIAADHHAKHHMRGDLTMDLTNSPAKGAYPITVEGYAIVRKDRKMSAATRATIGYFLSPEAQAMLPGLGYARLPQSVITKAKAQLAKAK